MDLASVSRKEDHGTGGRRGHGIGDDRRRARQDQRGSREARWEPRGAGTSSRVPQREEQPRVHHRGRSRDQQPEGAPEGARATGQSSSAELTTRGAVHPVVPESQPEMGGFQQL